ncbi:MAG TPA: beta-ketoacyl synthase N-terminal-like domain-containing protein [Anaerolineales bacterium]|nr:beta-ketoacyl synthase N-terminal-like domain-containing protein [Anaerolineales bacterium]
MTDVLIAGIGQTQVGEHWDVSIRELALYAIESAVKDAGGLRPQALYVGNMLAPALSRQSHLATLIADFAGLTGIEAFTVEAGGASGGAALRAGYLAVLSGAVEVALVVGVEKITDQVGGSVESAMSTTTDADYEAEHGLTTTAQAALLMQRYLYEFKPPREAFGGFPITAHANGKGNANAMFRSTVKPESYARAGMVAAPLNMFDVAPNADGAAAVVLARPGLLTERLEHPSVRISGSSVVTDTLALHDRPDPLDFRAVRASVEQACRQAGIMPSDVDMFELYDAFSIYSALSLEAAGFASRGEGWKMTENGGISLTGSLPLTTFGGLKARGNPGGATGVYQIVESTLQLRGQAGANQVPDAKRALVQCLGGPASTVVTHVLEGVER